MSDRKRWALAVAACMAVGLWLRLRGLSAEGFADDEVHKWLAANRYLHGDIGGDDVEHPMLMKSLIALCIAIFPRSWAPETLTRLPNVLAGTLCIWALAELGRKLFGRSTGLLAAALAAVSVTLIGYQRVAKEDTLVGLFTLLLLWCVAEGWERRGAAALGAMFASKYFFFFAPLPVIAWHAWGAARRPPWVKLAALAALVWAALNWTPFMPSTWAYLRDHLAGNHISTPSLYFMGHLYQNLPLRLLQGLPPWFYVVFAAAKLTPPVFIAALAGMALALYRMEKEHRLLLSWTVFWFAVWMLSGAKYGRYFVSILPAFLLFAAHAAVEAVRALAARLNGLPGELRRALSPLLAAPLSLPLLLAGAELHAAIRFAPHHRLYVSAIAGGEKNLDWLFPHCDYFDAGFREAIQHIAQHAEPGAEIATEIDLPARYYAGRADLMITHGSECRSPGPCYVVTQPGRIYLHNREPLAGLANRPPWHVETIRGRPAATVYRLHAAETATARK
jgi:4-amino-4-deoxy-L-arabinose transferase-like glycosyltransferase